MSEKIRLGIVGLRNIGMRHLRQACALPGCDVVAVADMEESRREAARVAHGVGKLYRTADELLADSGIDAVVLAVPNPIHASLTIQALQAGKHVLVEKPICRTMEEAEAILKARNETGRRVMVGMNKRYFPGSRGLRQAIQNGAIGKIQYGRTYWRRRRLEEATWLRGDWFFDPVASGGGPLLDLGVHFLDLSMFLLGFPKVRSVTGITTSGIGLVEGEKRGKKYHVEDAGFGVVRFENGMMLELETSYFQNTTDEGQDTLFYGTTGSLQMHKTPLLLAHDGKETRPIPFELDPDGPANPVDHFVRILRNEGPEENSAEEACEGVRIIRAFYESARSGETVILNGGNGK